MPVFDRLFCILKYIGIWKCETLKEYKFQDYKHNCIERHIESNI